MRLHLFRTVAFWISTVTMAAAFATYLVTAVLYLAPPNPVAALHMRTINAVLYPFFTQNWRLFAPSPIRANFILTARCQVGDKVTEWQDLKTPMLARHHRDRSSPMSRLLRPQTTAVHQILGRSGDEWLPLICRHDRSLPACRGEDETSRKRRETALFIVNRVASAACDELVGVGRTSRVQGRILVNQPPPWSQRYASAEVGTTRYLQLPWGEYQSWRHRE